MSPKQCSGAVQCGQSPVNKVEAQPQRDKNILYIQYTQLLETSLVLLFNLSTKK